MEIKKTQNQTVDPYKSRLQGLEENKADPATKVVVQNKTPNSDTISLSQEAKLRTAAFSAANQTPDIRADKVAKLKSQVQNGSYVIDEKKIATSLLNTEMALRKSIKE